MGLLGTLMGNLKAPLAYLINASNGFLVTVLANVAEAASAAPFAVAPGVGTTPGATLPLLLKLFYLSCLPTAIARLLCPKSAGSRL